QVEDLGKRGTASLSLQRRTSSTSTCGTCSGVVEGEGKERRSHSRDTKKNSPRTPSTSTTSRPARTSTTTTARPLFFEAQPGSGPPVSSTSVLHLPEMKFLSLTGQTFADVSERSKLGILDSFRVWQSWRRTVPHVFRERHVLDLSFSTPEHLIVYAVEK
ncbi:unnamed protein product, partial [Amoebophrya sp. A25]